jgi:hypothetical protein
MKPFTIILLLFTILSCEKDKNESKQNYEIKGFAQKGPFTAGTNITVMELKNNLQPTGLIYYSIVSDNYGSFNLPEVELSSNYVELMADGYFFNEYFGYGTVYKLVLKAIADVSKDSEININILTHISAERIKHLVYNEGKTFQDAKTQSQNEILKIFNMDGNAIINYEKLNIAETGELNSKLLAISSIIQGNRSIPKLTEFLTNLALDIKTDGVIDSKELQMNLATSAALCNVGDIRKNLSNFYGNDSVFNNFQNYVKLFVENTEFEPLIKLNFPITSQWEENLLAQPDNAILDTTATYCLNLDLSDHYLSDLELSIQILNISGTGNIIYLTKDLTGWRYENEYCSGVQCGVFLNSYTLNSASENPLAIKFQGSGEIKMTVLIEPPYLSGDDQNYIIKYMKW